MVLVGTALNEMAFPVPVSDSVAGPVPTLNVLLLPAAGEDVGARAAIEGVAVAVSGEDVQRAESATKVLPPLVEPITVVRPEMVSWPGCCSR